MCDRLLLAFMCVAAVVRVLVPCSISCSTCRNLRLFSLQLESELFSFRLSLYLSRAVAGHRAETLHVEAPLLLLSHPETPLSAGPPTQQVHHLVREEKRRGKWSHGS